MGLCFTRKKRARLLRGVKRAAAIELADNLELVESVHAVRNDEDLARLWCRVKLGASLREELEALDTVRRLKSCGKLVEMNSGLRATPQARGHGSRLDWWLALQDMKTHDMEPITIKL